MVDGDLEIGAMTALQDVVDSPLVAAATAGLLPAACRAAVPSRLLRGMASIGGEAIQDEADSELVAALLALNAVFLVAHRREPRESPALRFLRSPALDLTGGGVLRAVVVPGAPHGAALERAASLPSSTPLVAVAVTATFSGDKLARVRLAVTGLDAPPARVMEAESQLERTAGEDDVLEKAADLVAEHAPFRGDLWASERHRRRLARPLVRRALKAALQRGRRRDRTEPPRTAPSHGIPAPMPYFTSGRLELTVNGRTLRAEAEARTSLLDLLRAAGIFGVKSGCSTGRCGACTVLLDGRPAASCLTLAVRAQGRSVLTVEGLGTPEAPHPLQSAFAETGAVGCGFCVPGLVLQARALLEAVPDPTPDQVRDALSGLCRCTGFAAAVAAVQAAARGPS
jgi:aerobic-type carbon monoxide dehydrogenase small subunit (CoxS/CutS family)/CO/xanthine dehydrogenase FAD-binding subunit